MSEEFIDTYPIFGACRWEKRAVSSYSVCLLHRNPNTDYVSQRFAVSCFLDPAAPCTNAETCTSCVTQLDRFQERQRISWNFVDAPSMKAQFRNSSKFTR